MPGKNGLSHLYPKDLRVFSLMAKSGAMSSNTFHALDITNNRISTYKKCGYIRQVSSPNKHGGDVKTFFELTNKGKEFCRSQGINSFVSNGHALNHNAKVSEYVATHLSKQEIDSCLSERELNPLIEDRLNEYLKDHEDERYEELLDGLKNHSLSMPDIVYKNEQGVMEAIEIVTNNYKDSEIEAKITTCNLLSMEITIVHT